ncbi:anthranilate synthase family protein [Streptomyces sp. NPDC058623]|uniref:anthranilate synthase family protein n=1 Tax=Streptomyces sp. NPDC058623 TaxID=3346563 RepID=UPI003653AAF3
MNATSGAAREAAILDAVTGPNPPPFALLHRPETLGAGSVQVLVGEVSEHRTLADIPLPEPGEPGAARDVLVLTPYRQLVELGFACMDDGAPLLALTPSDQAVLSLETVLSRLPDVPIRCSEGGFEQDDVEYAEIVRRITAEEITRGAGSNFVIKRSFVTEIGAYTSRTALTLFRRLLEHESGAYWTFLVHTGGRTLVGASPERHVSVDGGTAVMNPVSGTYRYPPSGPQVDGVLDFLADTKETDELYMVVDEELKMMCRVCPDEVRVTGPHLKEMARLAHTEYYIEGTTAADPREILRRTMFAPTVTGSPLENACRVIVKYETRGRGYYSGVLSLIGREDGRPTMDSAVVIRTADIDARGRVRIDVGATLVRHSDPASEAAETRAKAAGLLAALGVVEREGPSESPADVSAAAGSAARRSLNDEPRVRAALRKRNDHLAAFWLAQEETAPACEPVLDGWRALVVDAEDTFTEMITRQLRSLGLRVEVCRFDEPYSPAEHDLVVLGPGPGDPRDAQDARMARLRDTVEELLARRQPFLAVCLSHQVLSTRLGLEVVRLDPPNQGVRREIDLFGVRQRVGLYNTFAAHGRDAVIDVPGVGRVEVGRDTSTGEVHALRGPFFASIQFHAESLLTENGPDIFAGLLVGLGPVRGGAPAVGRTRVSALTSMGEPW